MINESGPYLIWDRIQPHLKLAGRDIYLVPETHLPFQPDVILVEQDSWLVLGDQHTVKHDDRPAWVQANELEDSPEYSPGTVIPASGMPVRLTAIIYALGKQPACQPEWAERALRRVVQYCQEHDLKRLQLPVLGYRHGGLELQQFTDLLYTVLHDSPHGMPVTIMIGLSDLSIRNRILELLKS
jgi:hypothetical protein